MKTLLTLTLVLALALPAVALDLGPARPDKPASAYPPHAPAPDRQGGDTIDDAVVIALPYSGAGTTVGYTDDYDEVCPYSQSTSPDVVYTVTPATDTAVDIDLFGSTYDTKVYVYDADMALVACNDDFYPDYVSKLENVALAADVQYYVVIDGYGGDAGDYALEISAFEPCVLECPVGAELEGEPPLVDDYEDAFNAGCGGLGGWSAITQPAFCGVSGWYLYQGSQVRDTDWFLITLPETGHLEIVGDAEFATYMFELGPQDCSEVAVIQNVQIGPCQPATMDIYGEAGADIWFWVGPTTFEGPVNEYLYVLHTNLGPVATEAQSWSAVKELFD